MLKTIESRWQSMTAGQIILLCLLVGLIVGLFVGWRTSLPDQKQIPPYALPSLPDDAVAIESLSTLGFFEADIRIQAANGQTYIYLSWEEEGKVWSADDLHETSNDGEPCSAEITSLMEASAGPIVECSTAAIIGERCPGPIVSIAVTKTGEVWEMAQYSQCAYSFNISLFLIEILSLFVGLFLASFKLIGKWFPLEDV